MSLTLIIWLALFGLFLVLIFVRPAWGVALYMLSFFACPPLWWWGKGSSIASIRWNFYGGIGLLVAVILSRLLRGSKFDTNKWSRRILWASLGILVNATIVHIIFARNMEVSSSAYFLLAKFVLLFWMIALTIKDKKDFNIVIMSMVMGAAYIGYEATVNDRGRLRADRLEGIGAPGANGANQCASLMVTMLPLVGTIFISGSRKQRLLMLPIAPMIINVILLCNSRGAFLAAIAGGMVFVLVAPSRVRKQAMYVFGLGIIATWFMLNDPRILERFSTVLASEEERDSSAAGRLDYWKAGIRMISDYPMGAGGDGFKRVHGPKYIQEVSGAEFGARSVHNGYINEACEWGIQGIILRLSFVGSALWIFISVSRRCSRNGETSHAMIGCTFAASMTGFLVTSMFGDYMDAEWGYWMVALAIGYLKVFSQPESSNVAYISDSMERLRHTQYQNQLIQL